MMVRCGYVSVTSTGEGTGVPDDAFAMVSVRGPDGGCFRAEYVTREDAMRHYRELGRLLAEMPIEPGA